MWQAVLATALQDALGVYNGPAPKDARDARAWIGTEDFYNVCRYAGREPEEVLRLWRDGQLNASQRPQGNRLGSKRRKRAKLEEAA